MRKKSIKTYAEELWKDIEEQRGERPRMLRHMVEKTAADQRHLQILDNEIDEEIRLGQESEMHGIVRMVWGSQGQQKQEVNPILVQRDKASRTVTDDLKDLRLMLDYVSKNAASFKTAYGNVSAASVGAIQRSILAIEAEGGDKFFGEPAFDVNDLLDVENGKGVMSVLAADKLMLNPKLYSTFLLWLMTELYAQLPEVGDLDLPKLIFFFDEAHMLFDGTSKALTDKLEQIIRLIRSKGVGIYFITQSPTDIPDEILAQLSNRVQHALRAFTPKEQKGVRAAAQTFRANPAFKTEDAIMNLETGEALVSFLDAKGAPSVVERAKMLFPLSQIGAVTEGQRLDIKNALPPRIKAYEDFFDRESAYEILTAQNEQEAAALEEARQAKEREKEEARQAKELEKAEKAERKQKSNSWTRTIFGTLVGAVATSVARNVSNSVTKGITNKTAKSVAKSTTHKLTKDILKSIFGQ